LQGLEAESFAELRESADETAAAASPVGPKEPGTPGTPPGPQAPAPGGRPAGAAIDLGDTVTLWAGRYAFKGMIDRLVLSAVITIAMILALGWWPWARKGWPVALAILVLLWAYQFGVYIGRRLGHRYRLTPQTFFHERGILVKSTSPIEIIRIDDITLKQTLLERLVGVGTIRILSNDTTDPLLVMKGIAEVRRAFDTIDQARRAERRRRAVRINAV